jgi:hypothetical protein
MRVKNLKLAVISCAALGLSVVSSQADETDIWPYLQSAISANAVASAIAAVDGCENALKFSESQANNQRTLSVTCTNDSNEDETVQVIFDEFGDQLIPNRFVFAG